MMQLKTQNEKQRYAKRITNLDYPDPDVIRVDDVYYMLSTTMHFMPGGEILRSYDLIHWEHASYVFDTLDHTHQQTLTNGENAYGQGMWAGSIRFHKNIFYICFSANDTQKTYLYTSKNILGPWTKSTIDGFYHDCSLFFDDDERVYIIYGNKYVHLTELASDLSGPLQGGLQRIIVSDEGNPRLGYEGAHFYKINGKYYVFLIHSLRDTWKRVEACFVADSLTGEFIGGDVFNEDQGYCNQGIAQGGIVETPNGWYAILFQDHGAVGRIPVLVPVCFENGFPKFGEQNDFLISPTKKDYVYEPLVASDDFKMPKGLSANEKQERYGCFGLKSAWQFNHEPEERLLHVDNSSGIVEIETGEICRNLYEAKNTLTQRMRYPNCKSEVTVDGSGLKDGDYSGICALQGCYGMIALTKSDGKFYLVMMNREADESSLQGIEQEHIAIQNSVVRLKVEVDFTMMKDEASFYYEEHGVWKMLGGRHKLYFKMDHFVGCRFGLFVYSTKEIGGKARFLEFVYGD